MANPFEEYDDLDELAARLKAADAGERRVAVMELGHAGDPAAVALLASVVLDPGRRRAPAGGALARRI